MKKYLIISLAINLIFSNGIVEFDSFYSESIEEQRNYTIYLPDGYYESDTQYPVIYFLHGFGGDNNSYNSFHSSLNSMIADGSIMEMIVVSADGSTSSGLGNPGWTWSALPTASGVV